MTESMIQDMARPVRPTKGLLAHTLRRRSQRAFRTVVTLLLGVLAIGCTRLPGPALPNRHTDAEGVPGEVASAPRSTWPVAVVIDSSGSMAAPDMGGQVTRLAAAQRAVRELAQALPEGTPVALVSYGDRAPKDAPLSRETCADVSVRVPFGPVTPAFTEETVRLAPSGWTPMAAALTKAAEIAPEGPAHIVLLTDGEDSCAPPDPCETVAALVDQHPGLVVSAVGVRASSPQLACIAGRGNGSYVIADSAAQLVRRLVVIRDPADAATVLSPRGLSNIVPGQSLAEIRELYPDFPQPPPVQAGLVVEVTWRGCAWAFDDRGVLREISLGAGSTIDGLKVGSPAADLEVLGPAVVVTTLPTGGEARIYRADGVAGLGWYIEVKEGRVIRVVLCTGCLPQQTTSSWVPCAGAQWAVEGEDHNGRLVVAMCEDGMGTYANGKKLGSLTVTDRFPFGGSGSADGRQVTIADARTDTVMTFTSGRNATVTRQLAMVRRYPDASCGVTSSMREAMRAAGAEMAEGRLTAVCVDGWSQIASDDLGDSTLLLRSDGVGWQYYTGFPTTICNSKYRAVGGPEAFGGSPRFRAC